MHPVNNNYFIDTTWADPEGGGGQGVRTYPGIARLLIFAMLKFSVIRPLLGIWTPTEKFFWISASTTPL